MEKTQKRLNLSLSLDLGDKAQIDAVLDFLSKLTGVEVTSVAPPKNKAKQISAKTSNKKVAEKQEPAAQDPDPEEVCTIASVRALVTEKAPNHKVAIKAKLTELGAPNVTKLDPAKFREFTDFLEAL